MSGKEEKESIVRDSLPAKKQCSDEVSKESHSMTKNSVLGAELPRRSFLKGAGATIAVSAAPAIAAVDDARIGNNSPAQAVSESSIRLTVNGKRIRLKARDNLTLAELLRDELDLIGTKIGCNRSECGACTVLMNGKPVYSCSHLAVWADGQEIETIESLSANGQLSSVQKAFVDNNGAQCGFCTPGQIMTATALLAENPIPTPEEVKVALTGNLCRCSNYNAIVESVIAAAETGETNERF